jgi:hypothetical protein
VPRSARRAPAQRPEVLDADAGRRTLFEAEDQRVLVSPGCVGRCRSVLLQSRVPGWWTGPAVEGCRSSLRRADRRHGAVRQARDGRDQSDGAITPSRLGDHDSKRSAPTARSGCSRHPGPGVCPGAGLSAGSGGQAADVVIAQAVEHQTGQFAGGGDDADVATPPRSDPVADLPEAGVRGDALHGLDRGPPDQPGALLICGNPGRQLAGCPVISGSSRRWLTAPGWCRGPGSGVSPTA